MKNTDEELAEEALKDQAGMLSKAFGLEESEEYKIPDYDMGWNLAWKDSVTTVDDLPAHSEKGDACYVAEDDTVYVFSEDHGWMALASRGKPESVLDTSSDLEWLTEKLKVGLGVDHIEVTQVPPEYPEDIVTTEEIEPSRVTDSDTVREAMDKIMSQAIQPRIVLAPESLSSTFYDYFKFHMERPSLARRILPPVEEDE